ncbi:unnamed protein product [Prorocentrum cordatum]|uniref:Fe2OG dioxygenase domain-containing protein n=1 Tax=Prorocentrum cordatum TaxID=2364126 RepID=A0ABN9Y7X0_9DINO|nr:unnamed protein product [Polarella glacialis]|mmetsp:Transcript_68101/g.182312  ORF Transcript_68101/g.182312 Transcript_68101/m.182312 type:complete len:317 (+) Transcript_68101:105-1055(+)
MSILTPPLVDVRCFFDGAGTELEKSASAEAARWACRAHGFLALPAHGGIASEVVVAAFDSIQALFAMPQEKKMELAFRDVRENVGYIQLGREKPDLSEAAPDPKEVFQFAPGKRQLPAEIEEPLAALFRAGMAASRAALRCLARSLDLPEDELAASTRDADLCTLRCIHYPGGAAPRSTRCGAHTDFGLCTLLLHEQGGAPGLQAADRTTGEWRDVVPPPGAAGADGGVAYVNLGDMLSRWTNGECCATPHRVVAPADSAQAARSRFVLALFCDADAATSLACLPQFTSAERPPLFQPMSAGDFKAMRLAGITAVS